MSDAHEERIFWDETFHSETFDFRSQINFARFDGRVFVKCSLLLDHGTEQLAFTGCVFKDCNIDHLDSDEARGIRSENNLFDRPIEERRRDFEKRLAEMVIARTKRDSVSFS